MKFTLERDLSREDEAEDDSLVKECRVESVDVFVAYWAIYSLQRSSMAFQGT